MVMSLCVCVWLFIAVEMSKLVQQLWLLNICSNILFYSYFYSNFNTTLILFFFLKLNYTKLKGLVNFLLLIYLEYIINFNYLAYLHHCTILIFSRCLFSIYKTNWLHYFIVLINIWDMFVEIRLSVVGLTNLKLCEHNTTVICE